MTVLFAIFALLLGMGISFRSFFESFDLISGDLGDARFNTVILEHTWLWLKGVHPFLFDLPMYYPHPNAYAYSDFLLGSAPFYWGARFFGFDAPHSFQIWLMAGVATTYVAFFLLLKKGLKLNAFLSIAGAYLFSFSVVRMAHIEHAQLSSAFWVILSAYGALKLYRDPRSRLGMIQFGLGAVLQFMTAFYFFWFWIWTLAILFLYISVSKERRAAFKAWFARFDWRFFLGVGFVCVVLASPFLWHYALAAKEMGMRGWVSISATVPRFYSWLALPTDHWESSWIPFQTQIQSLPMVHEHYLSFGLFSWGVMLWALVKVYRNSETRWMSIPILVMFIFTISIGRISPWAFMTYLFPAGGAIRAVGRIQIFMLLFWIPVLLFALKEKRFSWLILLLVFSEGIYSNQQVFSAKAEALQIENLKREIPESCQILAYLSKSGVSDYSAQLDAVRAAFESGRSTVNGYSGNQPKDYDVARWAAQLKADGHSVCEISQR